MTIFCMPFFEIMDVLKTILPSSSYKLLFRFSLILETTCGKKLPIEQVLFPISNIGTYLFQYGP